MAHIAYILKLTLRDVEIKSHEKLKAKLAQLEPQLLEAKKREKKQGRIRKSHAESSTSQLKCRRV